MPKQDATEAVQYKIPGVVYAIFSLMLFIMGMMYQKIQTQSGKGGFLGLGGGSGATPTKTTEAANQPTFKPFDYKKDIGTLSPKGDKNAKVTIVIFSDFECPYCAALAGYNTQVMDSLKSRITDWKPAVPGIMQDYVDEGKVKIYFRDFPAHQNSITFHNAGRCANEQGKFWEMHEQLFALQDVGGAGTDPVAKMNELAANLGLDTEKFANCLESKKYQKQIDADLQAAQELGVGGTPHIFINSQSISGADTYDSFKKIIDEELKK